MKIILRLYYIFFIVSLFVLGLFIYEKNRLNAMWGTEFLILSMVYVEVPDDRSFDSVFSEVDSFISPELSSPVKEEFQKTRDFDELTAFLKENRSTVWQQISHKINVQRKRIRNIEYVLWASLMVAFSFLILKRKTVYKIIKFIFWG